jgi:hypothetical protein
VGVSVGQVEGWAVHTREDEALKDGHARRKDAERLRLLYVGMTRARDVLVIPVCPERPERTLMADLQELTPWPPRRPRQVLDRERGMRGEMLDRPLGDRMRLRGERPIRAGKELATRGTC